MARILIADDQSDVLRTMATIVELAGHEALTAGDGATASKMALEQSPDLVLTDVQMDGFDCIREIREQRPSVSVIAVSGHATDSEYLTPARDVGVDCILAKPFSAEKLIEIVDAFLSR